MHHIVSGKQMTTSQFDGSEVLWRSLSILVFKIHIVL